MGRFIDLTGQRFGKLTVIERAENKGNHAAWACVCDCGNKVIVNSSSLTGGRSLSCGCLRTEAITKHNKRYSRVYSIYRGMKQRCYYVKHDSYYLYGGRGIKICDEWVNDFMVFYDWAMENGYDDTKSIDRIDVNGNYEPSNCRWVSAKEQARNTRKIITLEFNGMVKTLEEWVCETNLPKTTIYDRITHGWTIEEALTTPKGEKRRST